MVSPRTAGMEIRRLEHRAYPRRRPFEILVAAAENECAAGGWLDEMEQHPQRRRLPGAVRPEEAGHRPALDVKDRSSTATKVAEALAEMLRAHHRALGDRLGLRSDRNSSTVSPYLSPPETPSVYESVPSLLRPGSVHIGTAPDSSCA